MIDQLKRDYLDAILDTNRESAFGIIDKSLEQGLSPETVIFKILIPAMEELAEIVKVEQDATLAQLYLGSQIAAEVTDKLTPLFKQKAETEGKVIIGTAREDFHGLGKKIVKGCLKSKMIEVIDLGLNVSAEKFVDEAMKQEAQIIGISSMMLHTARGENGPLKVRELLKKNGAEEQIKLVVGGAPYRFHRSLYKEVGANAWADNAITAAKVIMNLIKEIKSP